MQNVVIDQVLEPGTRVTVAMGTNRHLDGTLKRFLRILDFVIVQVLYILGNVDLLLVESMLFVHDKQLHKL